MATAAKAHDSICGKFGLKPLNKQNLLFYYAPAQGALSYTALSVNVMNPSLMLRICPKRDVTNVLLFNTLLGTGLYVYSAKHLQSISIKKRIAYSAFAAVSFSLGSILIWAILRSLVPQNVTLCTICGIGSTLTMIKLGRSYINHVDSLTG